jgi:hypothetical protein
MTGNPEYGTTLYDLMVKAANGDAAPLDVYLAADPRRAVSADRRYLLAVRHQFGAFREGRWYGYSAQPAKNPSPGTPTRTALVVLRGDTRGSRSWHELTVPAGVHIEDICAEGSTFRIRVNDAYVVTTGDEVFRVIADCSFGPTGLSEVEIAGGFDKLAGRAPLEVVGPAEPDAPLGHALALVIEDPTLGWFWFRPQRPARYTQTNEDGPSYELFADLSGRFDTALARAREIVPGIEAQVAAGARLVQAIKPDFAKSEAPRLLGADFRYDGSVHISIDDGFESSASADLELGTDGKLHLLEIDDN